ncbi:MAG: DNA-directed RNA polymerase subunit beta [Candidatus Ancaeobacter aquaticus]|nr:DNA-directed RNA polymerase subunit beta [Candidatus Ancaeobacter aquaticus]
MRKPITKRSSFAKFQDVVDMPHLIEMQINSYNDYLQVDTIPEKMENKGLQAVFNEILPVTSYDESLVLEYRGYTIGVPKYDLLECQRRGLTYSAPLKVNFRLKDHGAIKDEVVYMGMIPLMSPTGTFIINGAERVIVSQLHRSPGICFEQEAHPSGLTLFSLRIIPYRGSWLEVKFDMNDLMYAYIDRRKGRRKILATTFLRAIGYGTNDEILGQFFGKDEIKIDGKINSADLIGKILARDVKDDKSGAIISRAPDKITKVLLTRLEDLNIKTIEILKNANDESPIIKMMRKDPIDSQEAALKDIYKKLRPGDPATITNAKALIRRLFFDRRRYDLGRVGRFKLNQKLAMKLTEDELSLTTLRKEDIMRAIKYLLNLKNGEGKIDDIDHLGNRRVRSVGELLQNQCRIGLARMERMIKERMNLYDVNQESLTPHKLINPKGFSSVIKDFFGRSQLSQFMDQTNALSELTHKRRLSALGPGGLNRERSGFEVRDVHTSHYGRICPIETPEGPNIGLIASMGTYARVNEYGFLETPYRKAAEGRVTDKIEYLTADVEEQFIIAQANAEIDDKGIFASDKVQVRYKGDVLLVSPEKVDYMDVSPRQLVSVAAGLIPFLEHDDANRALMGSNMQRQAVPLVITEAPLVATGLEYRTARDSGVMELSAEDGVVEEVDSKNIRIGKKDYPLRKYLRSNAGTSVNQRPIVKKGDKIKKGQIIADGPATKDGELALGKNVLVSFMPWGGYNFEDAILISERLVRDDVFTSIHIEEFEVGARDTKLGKEEITRDIPNVGEEALKDLGEDGVIRLGAEVKSGDILVGKITPKSETELSPEERLLRAIFGEKAADVRDTSLKVSSGIEGVVMDVRVFARKDRARTDQDKLEEKKELRKITSDFKVKYEIIKEERSIRMEELLLGQKLTMDIVNTETGEFVISKDKKVTRAQLEKLEMIDYKNIEIPQSSISYEIKKILMDYDKANEEFETAENRMAEKVKKGDELDPGVIKQVKVYIGSKRKLQVGDKMAGRHGNKGIVAKILADEDMPFLPDGRPVDMVLNPLGVPSRMNVGQVLETHLGWAAEILGLKVMTPVFDGIKESKIREMLVQANLPESGKVELFDGRTGEKFDQKVVVGYIYMMKLGHLVADKIHARSIGPYSLVTQQPLGGKAQFGGQRFGEMEVWALESYGAAYLLQELMTVKSDDVVGRTKIYESIVKGRNYLEAGTPESFNVLIKEMQSLALDVRPEREKDKE